MRITLFMLVLLLAACGSGGREYCDSYWYQDSDGRWYEGGSCYEVPYYYKHFGEYERSLGYESPSQLESW